MIAEQLRCLSRHDLGGQGRCGEGTAVLEHGGRRYLYLAHEQPPANFSVLDVTDPRAPRLLTQTRLPHGGVRSNSLAVGDGLLLVAYQVQAPGQQPAGIQVFDLSRQAEPRLAGLLDLSGPRSRGTHWVGYTGGRYAYLSTGTPDSRPRDPRDDQFPVIVDLTQPDRPTEAGRWWLPGTQDGDGAPRRPGTNGGTPGSARTTSTCILNASTGLMSATWMRGPSSWTPPTWPRPGWWPSSTITRRWPGSPTPCCRCPAGTCW